MRRRSNKSMSKTQKSLENISAGNVREWGSKSIKPNHHHSDAICLERNSVYEEELPKCFHSKGVKQAVQQGHDLINGYMRLRALLGRNPEFVELYEAGFLRQEI